MSVLFSAPALRGAAVEPLEVPGLAYYRPLPAKPDHRPELPLTALEQMYGYWSAE